VAKAGPCPPPAARETCTSGALPPQIIKDRRHHGAALESASCGALGVDAELVDLARDGCLCKESVLGLLELSKRWRDGGARSSDRLGRSTRQGRSLHASEAPEPPGAVWERVARCSSRTGQAVNREIEPTFFSCATGSGRRDDVTSTARGGDGVDDPNMSLQSTTILSSSPLHVGSCDRSSLEETSCSPAFRCLMRLSFQLLLAIFRSICCALRAAPRLSVAALFWLKIATSGRGALAGTICAPFSCENKGQANHPSSDDPEKTNIVSKMPRLTKSLSEEASTYQSLGPLIGEHREKSHWQPRIGRLPDCLRHTAQDFVRRREDRCSHSPRPGGSVDHHLADMERPSSERHNSSGVVLPNDGC
jgi:hypothetical protein